MSELFIGLMSGTSVDGVDGALVDFSGDFPKTRAFASEPMPESLREQLLSLQSPGADELARSALATVELTRLYAQVVRRLLTDGAARAGRGQSIRAIGAHGQTVRHRPELGYTLQLIDGALLAELTGLNVVCDFRSADIAAGGQGAPLVPAFHQAVFGHPQHRRAIINIGGIANLSLLAPGETALGCDSGPGNVLMDAWIEKNRLMRFDQDGAWARSGAADNELLSRLRSDPYFSVQPPKSTGRDLFNLEWLLSRLPQSIAPEDVQATLLELTAQSICDVAANFQVSEAFVCGGGAWNSALMERLGGLLDPVKVASTGQLGMDPQAVEAVAFAWLARRRMQRESGNLPAVTGARGPRVLGAVYPAPEV